MNNSDRVCSNERNRKLKCHMKIELYQEFKNPAKFFGSLLSNFKASHKKMVDGWDVRKIGKA